MRPDNSVKQMANQVDNALSDLLGTEIYEKWMPNEDREKLHAAREVVQRMQQ